MHVVRVTGRLGLDRPETLSEEDRERFVEIYRDETDEIRLPFETLAVLVVMYFAFLVAISRHRLVRWVFGGLFLSTSMEEQPGLSDQHRKASPWPLFIALGLALSEVGVFLDLIAIAVGGLLLLVGSLGGIMSESGYTTTPWPFIGALGLVLAIVGAVLTAIYPLGGGGALDLGFRAVSIAIAGLVCMGGSLVGRMFVGQRSAM